MPNDPVFNQYCKKLIKKYLKERNLNVQESVFNCFSSFIKYGKKCEEFSLAESGKILIESGLAARKAKTK